MQVQTWSSCPEFKWRFTINFRCGCNFQYCGLHTTIVVGGVSLHIIIIRYSTWISPCQGWPASADLTSRITSGYSGKMLAWRQLFQWMFSGMICSDVTVLATIRNQQIEEDLWIQTIYSTILINQKYGYQLSSYVAQLCTAELSSWLQNYSACWIWNLSSSIKSVSITLSRQTCASYPWSNGYDLCEKSLWIVILKSSIFCHSFGHSCFCLFASLSLALALGL